MGRRSSCNAHFWMFTCSQSQGLLLQLEQQRRGWFLCQLNILPNAATKKTRMVLFWSLSSTFQARIFGLSGSFKSAWFRCIQVDYAAHILFSSRPPTKAFLHG